MEAETIEGLQAAPIEDHWPPAAEGPWFHTRTAEDGTELHFLAQRGGSCVFLRDDGLCAVHVTLGPQAKPGFCREFPYHLVEEPRGWVAVVRPGCGGFHEAFQDGDPVGPELDAIAALPRVQPRRRFAPDAVVVVPGVTVDTPRWLGWEDDVIAVLEAHPDLGPVAAVAAVRDRLYTLAETAAPPEIDGRATLAVQAVIQALTQVMGAVLRQPGGPPERVLFARSAAERLELARAGIGPRALTPELSAYLHLLLRSHLVAKQWQAWGSVADGVGHWLLGVQVCLAQCPDDAPVSAAVFSEPYRHWLRLAHNQLIGAILRKARPALLDLFLHAR